MHLDSRLSGRAQALTFKLRRRQMDSILDNAVADFTAMEFSKDGCTDHAYCQRGQGAEVLCGPR